MKIFKVDGYFKDDGFEFNDMLIAEYDHTPEGYHDDDFFFYGLSEEDLKNSNEDDDADFVITSYTIEIK